MPLVRTAARAAPFVLLAGLVFAPAHGSSAPVGQQAAKPAAPAEVEAVCLDGSVLKLKVLDDKLELVTRYGSLQVPVADVRRVELATRIPPDVAERVTLLIGNLGHPDFDAREKATAELRGYRERAYFPLLKAVKHPDPEVGRRADESVRFIQQSVPASALESRDQDVIHTDDMRLTGRLSAAGLRVVSAQFGEQTLRLADVRTLRAAGSGGEDAATASAAPPHLVAYQGQFGKELVFTVTGVTPNGQPAAVWGTGQYTLDSALAAAAVHSGTLRPGQAGVVRVRVVASPPQFVGSTQNGLTSTHYGPYQGGAYEFVRR
ncbi:MAG: hypothetical protein K2X87_03430 [Gemmataceae bacterium]|nr:hypothetical protein [Gemmataceae bacterium]